MFVRDFGFVSAVGLVASSVVACAALGDGQANLSAQDDLTTAETQQALVAELPVPQIRRVILGNIPEATESMRNAVKAKLDPPYDFSNLDLPPIPGIDSIGDAIAVELNYQDMTVAAIYGDRDELAKFAAEVHARGLDQEVAASRVDLSETDPTLVPNSPQKQTLGWSTGIDNRARLGIQDGYATTHPKLQKIGRFVNDGSGSLIGRRIVMTAGHVVARLGGGDLSSFIPRHDWSTGVLQQPYGSEAPYAAYIGGGFFAKNCHITYDSVNCPRDDWAFVILNSNAFSGNHPGWFGYTSPDEATLQANYYYIWGYPLCGDPLSPSPCTSRTAYGQTSPCTIGSFMNADGSGGYKYQFATSCDASNGMSGSSVWTNALGGFAVVGFHFASSCTSPATCAASTYNSLAVRLDPGMAGTIAWLRTTYP